MRSDQIKVNDSIVGPTMSPEEFRMRLKELYDSVREVISDIQKGEETLEVLSKAPSKVQENPEFQKNVENLRKAIQHNKEFVEAISINLEEL